MTTPNLVADILERWPALNAENVINREITLNAMLGHMATQQHTEGKLAGVLHAIDFFKAKLGHAQQACECSICKAMREVEQLARDLKANAEIRRPGTDAHKQHCDGQPGSPASNG